ncbi:hypothetical protein [Paenibacillus sp. S150]|uniref:hypothetical protein n=1 Tax=Paenibacillus sp. S150 TaxID=2749826 RepID=UPI001C5856CE|nr:hypothetical protein [Paenibacillus sp. S150]MBW4080386.1 hypothetical protein [Paenibacillus sp. S150]
MERNLGEAIATIRRLLCSNNGIIAVISEQSGLVGFKNGISAVISEQSSLAGS